MALVEVGGGFTLICSVFIFLDALAALFVSLFIMISHDDLDQGMIEPLELSNNLA